VNARPAWSGLKTRPVVAAIFATILAAGCGSNPGGGSGGNDAVAPTSARQRLSGVLRGGQEPIVGATVTLYAVAENGFGSSDVTELATTTTDGSGNYTISTFACPAVASTETYITATGGSPGLGDGANGAIALMTAIGPCDQILESTTIAINELTTIAAQWALQQFADSTGHDIGAPASDLQGLDNAYVSFANLANQRSSDLSVDGEPSSFLPTAAQCGSGTPPLNCDGLERLNTLADIIAACVNSSGPSSTACQKLFCDASPGRSYSGDTCSGSGPLPTDTLAAAHSIAINPTINVAGLFELPTPNAPFDPLLAALPDGWEIALNFAPSDALFDSPVALALDGSGNVFIANGAGANDGSVSELPVSGGYSTGMNFAAPGATFDGPSSIAVDGDANIFVTNSAGDSVSELTEGSSYTAGSNFTTGDADFDGPAAIAMDSSADLFVANADGNSVSELSSFDYSTLANNYAPPAAMFDQPVAIALDSSANVFVANEAGNSVGELPEGDYSTGMNFMPPAASFSSPRSIALDGSANVFVANFGNSSVSELTESSSYATGLNFTAPGAAFSSPDSIALDGSANAWVVNFGTGSLDSASVSELTAGSTYGTGFNFAPAGGAFFYSPSAIALDSSGNLFITNQAGNSVTQLIGLATPVSTPIEPGISSPIPVGGGGVAIFVFLSLSVIWYGFRFLIAARRRAA